MAKHKKTESEVLRVYQKGNPSIYWIENDEKEYKRRKDFQENLFLNRLKFPPKMFENVELLEFGTGTGEHSLSYLQWGALCTFVEMNVHACKRAEKIFSSFAPDQAQYKIHNKSLFDFRSTRKYDIVVSMGVIHHTADKEEAFDIKSQYLKKGDFSFLVLAIQQECSSETFNEPSFIVWLTMKNKLSPLLMNYSLNSLIGQRSMEDEVENR